MDQQEVKNILAEVGAVLTNDHFVYTSGKHGSAYVNKDAVYLYPEKVARLCQGIAEHFISDKVSTIVAPAIGAIALSQWTAYRLGGLIAQQVLAAYAEKSEDGKTFLIKRGYDQHVTGKNVLVVEDILNTGGSAAEVVRAVRAIGGNVVGVGALCNRGGVTKEILDVPRLASLVNLDFEMWNEADCPLCQQEKPVNTVVGKGREFLSRQLA